MGGKLRMNSIRKNGMPIKFGYAVINTGITVNDS